MKVVAVTPGSPAALAGLSPGMIITQYNINSIGSMDDLRAAAIAGGTEAKLTAYDREINGNAFQYHIRFR